MKRLGATLVGLLLAALPVFGQQQFAKTGVLNIALINQSYRTAVTAYVDNLKATINKDLDTKREEIRLLTDQKNEAIQKGDSSKASSLDSSIATKRSDFMDYGKRRQEELTKVGETFKTDQMLQKFLQQDIEQAAFSKGFALILTATDPSVLWYGPDADITADVIHRLAADIGIPMEVPSKDSSIIP